jgi:hypothetical protein
VAAILKQRHIYRKSHGILRPKPLERAGSPQRPFLLVGRVGWRARNLRGRALVETRRAALGIQLPLTPAGIDLAREREADGGGRN